MAKSKWDNDSKLSDWFEKQLNELDEWGGHGSAIDAIGNCVDDKHMFSFCYEGLTKEIDTIDYINAAVDFGMDVKDNKIFYFYYNSVNFYFLARNKTEFKHMILAAIKQWKDDCKPIEPEKPQPTWEERMENLLQEIRGSHVGDPKGQSEQEAAWCKEIDAILKHQKEVRGERLFVG